MASAPPPQRREELVEHLLQCSVCLEPFNASDRKPPLLPCHHGLCHVCLEDMAARGRVRCPVCRTPIPFQRGVPVPRQFGVDHIRVTLLEYLAQHPEGDPLTSAQRREEEKCEKHVDEKLKYYCKTCKKRACPICVIREHKDHNSVNTAEVSESCKSEIEAACLQIEELMSAEQQAASDVSSELGALVSKEEAALEKMDEAFDCLEACLRHRRQTAREELKARVKQDRLQLEDVLASHESLLSAAHSTLHFGRRVVQLGSDSDLMLGLEQVQGALRELATRGQQAAVTPVQYQVNTKDLPVLTQAVSSYEVFAGRDDSVALVSTQDSPEMTSPLRAIHAGFTDEEISNEPEFVCQELQYDVRRCGPNCSVDVTRTILVNGETEDRLPWPGTYRFRGTRGTEALTQSSYWEVRVSAETRQEIKENNAWCEVGVAGEGAMKASTRGRWIAECSSHAVVTVCPSKRNTQVGVEALCQGRVLGRVAVAEFHPRLNQFLLGMLWDATHRRLFFIDVSTAEVLFQAELETTEPLFYVCDTSPVSCCGAEVKVELVTGDRVPMSDEKRNLIQRLLHQ